MADTHEILQSSTNAKNGVELCIGQLYADGDADSLDDWLWSQHAP